VLKSLLTKFPTRAIKNEIKICTLKVHEQKLKENTFICDDSIVVKE